MYKIIFASVFFSISYGQIGIEFSEKQLTGQSDFNINKNERFLMLPEVLESFKLMKKAALKEGINIKVVSGFRSFSKQKRIWNNKFIKNDSLGYSINENIKKIYNKVIKPKILFPNFANKVISIFLVSLKSI